MKIGINGRFLVAKQTGVQRAALNLVRTMLQIDRENEYVVFTGVGVGPLNEWKQENVTIVESNIRSGESIRNHLWEQFQLPKLAKKHKVDLLHSPANMAPLFYKGKSIVNIHDLCFVVNPQWYSFSFRTLYTLVIPRLARRATKIITNSNNSRNDLLQFCNIPAEKVNLVYWAVDGHFTNTEEESDADDHLLQSGDFILYVGSLEPRKNIGKLIEAFLLLRKKNPELKTQLVMIGGESRLFAEVKLHIDELKDDIHFKGFVGDSQLRAFYRNAKLVAYPSLYEGFGLPPLEAMASGTAVVTSVTSSLPEVVGDAAVMVNPHDVNQLAGAMELVLKDSDFRDQLVSKGFNQVKKYNWYRVARNTLAIYYELVNGECHNGSSFLPFDIWKKLVQLEHNKIKASIP